MHSPHDLLDRLSTLPGGEGGLTATDVESLRARYGDNRIVEPPRHRFWHALRDAASDPMLWFLLVVSALFFATGETLEASVLLLAMLPLLGMDAFLHRRTQLSTSALASRLASEAMALRDGTWQRIAASALVPGDRVRVGSGEAIPADGLWRAVEALQVDESSLSGESVPVRKQIAQDSKLRSEHWSFAGTRVLAGRGELQVLGTGADSRYGELVRLAVSTTQPRTPLQQAVTRLVLQLVWIALALCLLLAAVRLWQGQGWMDALLSGLTLAIAALPEEFPVVLSLFLGVGVFRLARRNALVRRAVAVEDIGRVSVLCTDKTGTLTEGRLRLRELRPLAALSTEQLAQRAAQSVAIDSTDPLDLCLRHEAAPSAPVPAVQQRFPFTEDRRRETVLLIEGETQIARMKGAPETVLRACAIDASEAAHWQAEAQSLAARGLKVLALAERLIDDAAEVTSEPDHGYRLLGLLGFGDPLRAGVPAALVRCRAQGLRVVMLTGDHPATAAAIAVEAGLCEGAPRVVSLDDAVSPEALARADVVARAQPKQKLALVQALQATGVAVAVTGDGVNDVPALKAADVGIAMGERGTQAAREAAAIVLLDDDFATLAGAIAEGRALYRNLRASFAYLLLVHLPFVLSAALVPAFGGPLLFLPIHIVWLELIIHPSAMLGFQREADGVDEAAPTRAGQLFDARVWRRLLLGAALGCVAVLLAQALPTWMGGAGSDALPRTLAVAALVAFSAVVLIGLGRSRSARLIAALALSSLALTLWPGASDVLGTAVPQLAPLLIALALGAAAAVGALALNPLGRARAS
jgi:Ca2+-transporting ATPase